MRAIRPPTVPPGTARLRISVNARLDRRHDRPLCRRARGALEKRARHGPRCLRNRHGHRRRQDGGVGRAGAPLSRRGCRSAIGSPFRPASSRTTTRRRSGGWPGAGRRGAGDRRSIAASGVAASGGATRRHRDRPRVARRGPCSPSRRTTRWIVEGAGGVLVPVNETELMVDLMILLGLPVLVVARSTLGTINHTLLTMEACARAALRVAGVVMVGRAESRRIATPIEASRPRGGGRRDAASSTPLDARRRWRSGARAALDPRRPASGPCCDDAMTRRRWSARDQRISGIPTRRCARAPAPLPIVRGEGVYLYTEDGRRILDGISSWWVNIHGHSHPAAE